MTKPEVKTSGFFDFWKRMNDLNFTKFSDFFDYNFKKNSRDSKGHKILTLQELAKRLGYRSPSLLSMISKGKRLPSPEILEELFEEWKIDHSLREIVRLRVEIEKRTSSNKNTLNLVNKLSKIDKKYNYQTIELDSFNSIKDWYNLVLQIMIGSSDFKEDYNYLSTILKKKVSPSQIKKGIESLLKIGLLARNSLSGELEKNILNSSIETTHDIPSEAIREHHRGMISRALESIDDDKPSDRHFNALTLRFSQDKMNEAKASILNYVKEFNELYFDENSSEVWQLNVQFFSHTISEDKIKKQKEVKYV